MTNDEIKALLRELSDRADAEGKVKSRRVWISFDRDEPEKKKKKKQARKREEAEPEASGEKKAAGISEDTPDDLETSGHERSSGISGESSNRESTKPGAASGEKKTAGISEDTPDDLETSGTGEEQDRDLDDLPEAGGNEAPEEDTGGSSGPDGFIKKITAFFRRRGADTGSSSDTEEAASDSPREPEIRDEGDRLVAEKRREIQQELDSLYRDKDEAGDGEEADQGSGSKADQRAESETEGTSETKSETESGSAESEAVQNGDADGRKKEGTTPRRFFEGLCRKLAASGKTKEAAASDAAEDGKTGPPTEGNVSEESASEESILKETDQEENRSQERGLNPDVSRKSSENPDEPETYSGQDAEKADDSASMRPIDDWTMEEEDEDVPSGEPAQQEQKKVSRYQEDYEDGFESDAADFRETEEDLPEEEHPESAAVSEESKGSFPVRLRGWLQAKGVTGRQLVMLACIVAALIVVIVIIARSSGEKSQSEGVTTDEGLTVLVERQPAAWCTHGSVTLKVRTDSPIQSIMVNGENVTFTGTTSSEVTVEADSSELSVMVVTQEAVLSGSVSLNYVDSEDPVVTVSSDGGLVTLTAADDKSGVAGIWYGVLEGFSDVPAYQAYTGPFTPEAGKEYAYFATDNAGNVAGPFYSDLVAAQGIALSEDTMMLFPGQTQTVSLTTDPAGAYLNHLSWSSSNEYVATVDDQGSVTAVAEGDALITVSADNVTSQSVQVSVRSSVSVTISAAGDVTLGDDETYGDTNSFDSVYAANGAEYFFSNVRSVLDADDLTIVNLEGPLTDQGTRRTDRQFCFRGDPSYVDILTDGSVEAVNLANNHSLDYGEEGLSDTEKVLTQADICYVYEDITQLINVNGVQVGLIGFEQLDTGTEKQAWMEQAIASLKAQGADLVIVSVHWGTELETSPDQDQITLGRAAVDAGADLVLGHHPHVLQGVERYAGKYICYSLGNFCFGGNSQPSGGLDTMIFQQTFEITREGGVSDGGVNIVPCSISSDSSWNNYQPTPATGDEADRIMSQINQLSAQFGTSF